MNNFNDTLSTLDDRFAHQAAIEHAAQSVLGVATKQRELSESITRLNNFGSALENVCGEVSIARMIDSGNRAFPVSIWIKACPLSMVVG